MYNAKKILHKCEICNSKLFSQFQNYGKVGLTAEYGKISIRICLNCSFIMINPRYTKKFYVNYYEKKYGKKSLGNKEITKEYIRSQIKRGHKVYNFFHKFLKKKGSILDHGSGAGYTMVPWIKNGWKSIGIDPYKTAVNKSKELENLDVKQAFGEKLPFKKDYFDLVVSLGSLEHSYNLKLSMNEINRVLKNNGLLIIRWRSNKLFGSPLEYYNHSHNRYFSRVTWKLLLQYYNFKIIKFFNEKVENYEGWEYILAKKKKIKKKVFISKKILKKEVKRMINYNVNYFNNYKKNAKKVETFFLKNKSFKEKEKYIKKNNIKLLNISYKKAVKRFFDENLFFLNFLKKTKNY